MGVEAVPESVGHYIAVWVGIPGGTGEEGVIGESSAGEGVPQEHEEGMWELGIEAVEVAGTRREGDRYQTGRGREGTVQGEGTGARPGEQGRWVWGLESVDSWAQGYPVQIHSLASL